MDIKNKKGQAVAEFFLTYGWAIFAGIITFGVLVYFGVFNPNTFRSENLYENSDNYYCIEWDDLVTRDRLLMNCYDFDEEKFDCIWEITDENKLFMWKPREKTRDINDLSQVEFNNLNCTKAIRI